MPYRNMPGPAQIVSVHCVRHTAQCVVNGTLCSMLSTALCILCIELTCHKLGTRLAGSDDLCGTVVGAASILLLSGLVGHTSHKLCRHAAAAAAVLPPAAMQSPVHEDNVSPCWRLHNTATDPTLQGSCMSEALAVGKRDSTAAVSTKMWCSRLQPANLPTDLPCKHPISMQHLL